VCAHFLVVRISEDARVCVDVGLSELTEASFEPRPSTPEVVPVGGRLEILCLLPQGVPTPVHRSVFLVPLPWPPTGSQTCESLTTR